MRPLLHEISTAHTPESLTSMILQSNPSLSHRIGEGRIEGPLQSGVVILRSALLGSSAAHYSFVAANPFLTFRSCGARTEVRSQDRTLVQFGNPWNLLDKLMAR